MNLRTIEEQFRHGEAIGCQVLFNPNGSANLERIMLTNLDTADIILLRDPVTLDIMVAYGAKIMSTLDPDLVAVFVMIEVDFHRPDLELWRVLGLIETLRGSQDCPQWQRKWERIDSPVPAVDRTEPLSELP